MTPGKDLPGPGEPEQDEDDLSQYENRGVNEPMFHISRFPVPALKHIRQLQEEPVIPSEDTGGLSLVQDLSRRENQKMIRGLRGTLAGIPRQDFGMALFYLVLAVVLQMSGLHLFGVGDIDVFPAVQLWPLLLLLDCCGIALRSTKIVSMIVISLACAVLLALDGAGIVALFLVFEVIFAGTRYAGPTLSRLTQIFAISLSVLSVAAAAVIGNAWQSALAAGLQAVVVFLTPMWWAANVRKQQQIAEVEQQRAQQAERMVQQERDLARLDLQLSVSRERAKMARDLHDVIAGRLSAIALQSEAAIRTSDPEVRLTVLRTSRETSLKALADMRQMIDVLHAGDELDAPTNAGGMDLDSELQALAVASTSAGNPAQLDLRISQELAAATASTLYRISQEALTHAGKHAPGQPVLLSLYSKDDGILLTVDNPVTHTESIAAEPRGYGLKNIAVRANELGGSFSAGAELGNWHLVARLPR